MKGIAQLLENALLRCCYSTLLLLGVCSPLYAQTNPYQIDDRCYNVYADALSQLNESYSLVLSDSMARLARRYNDKKAEVLAATIPVTHYNRNGDLAHTRQSAQALREIARKNDFMQYYYFAYSQEGTALLNDDRNAEAIALLGKMRAEATAANHPYGMYSSYVTLGHVYHTIFNYIEAENMYVMAAELAEAEMPEQSSSGAWLNAASTAMKNEKYDKAIEYANKALGDTKIIPSQSFNAIAYRTICQYMDGDTLKARKGCELYKNKVEVEDDDLGNKSEFIDYVECMLDRKYQEALEITGDMDETEEPLFAVECHKRMGNYTQALESEKERLNTIQETLSEYMQSNAAVMGTLLQTQNDSLKVSNLQLEVTQQNMALVNKELELQQAKKELELNATRQENTELELKRAKSEQEKLIVEQEKQKAEQAQAYKEYQLTRRTWQAGAAIGGLIFIALVTFSIFRQRSARILQATNKKLVVANKLAEDNLVVAQENQRIAEENQRRAELSEQMKTVFIQNMSHEIRTPLNSIVGFSQILADPEMFEFMSSNERREFADQISNNTNLLTKLVNDILNLSDLQSGQYKAELEEVDVNNICNICLLNMDRKVKEGVKMYFTSDLPEYYPIMSDQQCIQQVLNNLLGNACKFTNQGEIRLHVSLDENPGYVTFSVTDTGIGVPVEKAEVIFNQFEKLDDFVQGTGLGLPICRLIADALKGEVKLDTSYTGGGARFVFLHPTQQPTTETEA